MTELHLSAPARARLLASLLMVALVALLPRLLHLDSFLDSDEVNFWLPRSERFLNALQAGGFADTVISTHPGVTTMWLGSVGIVLRRWLLAWGLVESMPFGLLLTLMRVPAVLVHTLGVLVGYSLLRRMLPGGVALLAALFWAADPFVIAYSRILHVDGLMMTFATLSLLAACVYWHHERRARFLLLSAVCGALAVLSKSPGLAVLPVVGLVALLAWWRARPPAGPRPPLGTGLLLPLLGWGSVFALAVVLVWPAVWADPLRVYTYLRAGVEAEGGSPHVIGNYFLGQPTDVPGPLFYPVALALRTTPITLAGLLLLPLGLARRARRDHPSPDGRDLAALAAFVLLFVAAMSLFPKQLNRYSVPVFPALDVLAAVGWALALQQAGRWWRWQRLVPLGVGALALLAVLNSAWWHPYHVSAFNQALGGTRAGAYAFLLGDGEGLRQAADWLNAQPDITGVTVASTMINSIQPWMRPGAQTVAPDTGEPFAPQVGYVLIYIRYMQQGSYQPPLAAYYPAGTPVHTVRLHGVDYVTIYQVPRPLPAVPTVRFGPAITLHSYALDQHALRTTGTLTLTMQWRAEQPVAQDYLLFAHLLDARGQRVAQVDLPPGGPDQPTSQWQPGRYMLWRSPLPAPADLPPGSYWLALGLYDPESFARLAPDEPPPSGAPDAGGAALLIPLEIGP